MKTLCNKFCHDNNTPLKLMLHFDYSAPSWQKWLKYNTLVRHGCMYNIYKCGWHSIVHWRLTAHQVYHARPLKIWCQTTDKPYPISKNNFKSLVWGHLNMTCTTFGEDWMRYVAIETENVFSRKSKMAANFYKWKWAWTIPFESASSKEATVQMLFWYTSRFMSY